MGPLLRAVNAVAASIEEEFPNVLVDTLACESPFDGNFLSASAIAFRNRSCAQTNTRERRRASPGLAAMSSSACAPSSAPSPSR